MRRPLTAAMAATIYQMMRAAMAVVLPSTRGLTGSITAGQALCVLVFVHEIAQS